MPLPFLLVGGAVFGSLAAAGVVKSALSAVFIGTREMKRIQTENRVKEQDRLFELGINPKKMEMEKSRSEAIGIQADGLQFVKYRLEEADLPPKLKWLADEYCVTLEEMKQQLIGIRHLEMQYREGDGSELVKSICDRYGVDYEEMSFAWEGTPVNFEWVRKVSKARLKDKQLQASLEQIH